MNRDTKRVWAGGIAAGLAGVAASKSQADVIYTPDSATVNSSTTSTSAGIDFNGDGTDEFTINYDSSNGLTLQKNNDTGEYDASASPGVVAALHYGDSIDSSDASTSFPFSTPPKKGPAELNNGDGSSGQFVDSNPPTVQYIGVSVEPSGGSATTVYGWIGFEVTDDSSLQNLSGIVTGYAYDSSGNSITAGEVPEPTSLALLAAGAIGLLAYRRRSPIGPA
jgi:hypothetical protein